MSPDLHLQPEGVYGHDLMRGYQRIGHVSGMRYVTLRASRSLISPPRILVLLLVVAALRRVPAHNCNKTYTQTSAKPEPVNSASKVN
jgi:hypothetical protein